MSGTDVVVRPEEQAVHGMELAERVFTAERRAAIAKFLNVRAEDPALVPYLSVCASYGLNPVMGQIWLIPQRVKVRDGDASGWEDRYRPAVGRDGYLAIARRDSRYGGLRANVVCEHDTFEVEDDGSSDGPRILHKFASKPVVFEADASPHRWRGKIVGAWAKTWVRGEGATFFFAPIHEFFKMREKWAGSGPDRHRVLDANNNPVLEPDGAWGYASTMILKAAQSYVLRIAFGITGTVPADEIAGLGSAIDGSAVDEPELAEFAFEGLTEDEALRERLLRAVERVNELAPLSWPPAKCEMVLGGLPDAELERVAARIEHEAALLALRREEAAAARSEGGAGDSSRGDAPTAGGVTDAQVETEFADLPPEGSAAAWERRLASIDDELNDPEITPGRQAELVAERAAVEREIMAANNPDQERLV